MLLCINVCTKNTSNFAFVLRVIIFYRYSRTYTNNTLVVKLIFFVDHGHGDKHYIPEPLDCALLAQVLENLTYNGGKEEKNRFV